MSLQAVFVDESSTDLKLARRLTRGGMRADGWHPGGSVESLVARVAQAARSGGCDILLLDYRLDEEPDEAGVRARFRGGTVAAALREKAPELPVVLVTTVAKLEENLEEELAGSQSIRYEIMKGELQDYRYRPQIIEELVDLAAGFETATATVSRARTGNQWTVLGRLIGIDGTELESLEKAVSQPLPKPGYLVARWLLHELLRFSGPLLPEEDTATRLGLTLEGFRRATVRNWASRASYRGVFSVLRERWWRSRIGQHDQVSSDRRRFTLRTSEGSRHYTCHGIERSACGAVHLVSQG